MTSLDVESLFSTITLNETINDCVDLHIKDFHNGKLSKTYIFKLPETTTRESSFIFDYLFSKQVDGVAMCSPLKTNGWIVLQSTLNL